MNSRLAAVSDFLSPMLIKELRQELRTKGFVYGFMLMQGAMLLAILLSIASANKNFASDLGNGLFWTIVVIPLLIFIPRRGAISSNKESNAQLLDLVLITPLSAWKVMFGKWTTCVLQAVLFVISVLPYAVLRYFVGKVSLVQTGLALLFLLVSSMIISAFAIGSSASRKGKGSMGFTIFLLFFLFTGGTSVMNLFFGRTFRGVHSRGEIWHLFLLLLLFGALFVLLLLQMGAARIAPVGENHAFRQRIVGVAALILMAVLPAFGLEFGACALFAITLIGITFLSALVEKPQYLRSLYGGIYRIPLLGAVMRRFFTPGWQSGIDYVLLTLLLLLIISLEHGLPFNQGSAGFVVLFGALIQPVALLHLFRFELTLRSYLFVQGILAFLATIFNVLAEVVDAIGVVVVALFPIAALFSEPFLIKGFRGIIESGFSTIIVTMFMWVYLKTRAREHWRCVAALSRSIAGEEMAVEAMLSNGGALDLATTAELPKEDSSRRFDQGEEEQTHE